MAKRKPPKVRPTRPAVDRTVGDWRRARYRRRSKTGCGLIVSYHHASGQYRVDHYLANSELPYFALRLMNTTGRDAELIGRFASVDKAKAACERKKKPES
jgi:hypothetical protein